ncbi:recombinase family protein [Vibrio vulnificus]
MAIIPYARVSTGKQTQGLSLTLQTDTTLLERLAKENNTTVSNLAYHDPGISSYTGKNAKEGDLKRLRNDIKAGVIKSGDIIVMRALDRLSRQEIVSAENLYNEIIGAGVQIHTTIDNFTYKAGCKFSSFMKVLALSTANEESAKKSFLTNRYAAQRIQQFQNNEIPENGTAYDIGIGKHPFWVQLKDKVVQKHERNWDIGRVMFDRALKGDGVSTLMKYAHSVGLKLSYSAVAKMFNSPSVYGDLHVRHLKFQNGDFVLDGSNKPVPQSFVLKGYYPALATEAEYYQVRAIKDKLTRISNGQRKKISILAGYQKLYCGCCGMAMGISRNVKQRIEYYKCTNKLSKCFQPLRQDIIDTIVLNSISQHVFDNDETDTTRIDALELELKEKQDKHAQVTERFLMLGDSAGANAIAIINQLKNEVDSLVDEIEKEKESIANSVIDFGSVADFKDALDLYNEQQSRLEDYVQGDCELKKEIRDILKLLVKKITIDNRHLIKVELSNGATEYLYLLRRRDRKKLHDRYYVPIKIHDKHTIRELRENTPELVNHVSIDELDSLDLWFDDVANPLLTIKRKRHTRDKESEFFTMLQRHSAIEWKRSAIMKCGATTTQWQEFKNVDVTKYGWMKTEIQITTKSYTKQRKTVIYKEWNQDEICKVFNCRSLELIE